MGTHTKRFTTHADYQAFVNSGITYCPNVSVCENNYDVHINDNGTVVNPPRPTPPEQHDYVEIAGIKWATMNIGASAVTDYGLYFQWGNVSGRSSDDANTYDLSNYPYYDGHMTKYNEYDGVTTLGIEDDGVNAEWGGNWRMPTSAEMQSLLEATNTAWTYNYQASGVEGLILTDINDSSKELFFPAAGIRSTNHYSDNYGQCYYWSSTVLDEVQSGEVFSAHYLEGYNPWGGQLARSSYDL